MYLGLFSVDSDSKYFVLTFSSSNEYSSFMVKFLEFLRYKPSSSIVNTFNNISLSFDGLSDTGIRTPSSVALTSIRRFLPHHLPSPVRVCHKLAFLSLSLS